MLMQFGLETRFYPLVYKEKRMIFHLGQFVRNSSIFHKGMLKMIRMQIYDKYTKQYHKYVTRKPDNFAAGNDKYNQ
ncbi:hypothetical protein [Parabacteroides goldsteinii]|uniref:hypothetical protein n=1 Tax=Parabacteroides goldsteinii TaxID=328812 RepID=UPI00321B6AEE